ncbi:pilus assembly protein TadG-related protein [Streptomyces sp. NPDC053741]|uniref:pilus assembly protein TadG-related protein n=1 Tax=Streptomyces TaxID=1883 RepID=UPI0002C6A745|nr:MULTISPECIES: pilus assembly protein TadG-related protein [Streptomyces]AGJ56987.1 secreted protein [Streptomyces sp. PAMC 26508]MEE1777975.1 pilus assembly protein TadG-related protein [Streptomyces sp. JV181]WSK28543.1 pilus assembly protein TadG-related protein [[Kitasatospora] papulosa]
MTRRSRESGQAFPIYIMVVAGLLFLAFAYFAVGQASMKKNEAQTAADAAALAAAQDARDEWSWPGVFDLGEWDDLLSGRDVGAGSCSAADRLAAANGADSIACDADFWPEASYTVKVETNKTVGSSVIASTKTTKATATARAVIEPRCRIEEDTRPTPSPSADDDDGDTDEAEEQKAYKVVCDDVEDFRIDPKNLGLLPDLADLFSVHLADN